MAPVDISDAGLFADVCPNCGVEELFTFGTTEDGSEYAAQCEHCHVLLLSPDLSFWHEPQGGTYDETS